MKKPLEPFKAARRFSPSKIQEMRPDAGVTDGLECFPFLSSSDISALKEELPLYIAAVEDFDISYDPLHSFGNITRTLCLLEVGQQGICSLFSHCFPPRSGFSPHLRTHLVNVSTHSFETISGLS